ncbi:MAG: non-reducing end alpha-L-arabinofuranosidase family hydrolase [Sandaracinaceae bacterium]
MASQAHRGALLLALFTCGSLGCDDVAPDDAGPPGIDAGPRDASAGLDAGSTDRDAGPPVDATFPSPDAGSDAGARCPEAVAEVLAGQFAWTSTGPLVLPPAPYHAVKDPSIVRYGGRHHVFTTMRQMGQSPDIGYLSFVDWPDALSATWTFLDLTDDYQAAPDVFYFAPQGRWYMVLQLANMARGVPYGAAYTTTDDIGDPTSWAPATSLGVMQTPTGKVGLDFWVIADATRAYLFFTTDDGDLWRTSTAIADFPTGWGPVELALHSDLFEATHTYALMGEGRYLTIAEAQGGSGHRYYQAYIADQLDGAWTPLATTLGQPFAGPSNVTDVGAHWTDAYSHGELVRAGYDERVLVDPSNLQFVVQGVLNADWTSNYGDIPWHLGRLDFVRPASCP